MPIFTLDWKCCNALTRPQWSAFLYLEAISLITKGRRNYFLHLLLLLLLLLPSGAHQKSVSGLTSAAGDKDLLSRHLSQLCTKFLLILSMHCLLNISFFYLFAKNSDFVVSFCFVVDFVSLQSKQRVLSFQIPILDTFSRISILSFRRIGQRAFCRIMSIFPHLSCSFQMGLHDRVRWLGTPLHGHSYLSLWRRSAPPYFISSECSEGYAGHPQKVA